MKRMDRQKVCALLAAAAAVLWLGLFPLALIRFDEASGLKLLYSYSGFTQTKRDTMRLFAMIGVVLLAVSLALGQWKRVIVKEPGRALAVCYFGWVLLSAFFGSGAGLLASNGEKLIWEGAGRYEGLSTQLVYCAIFLCLSLCRPGIRSGAWGAGTALVLYAVIVALQYAGGNPLGLYPGRLSIYTNYEFQGTIGNIDMGAGYLTIVTPLLLAYYATQKGKLSVLALPAGLTGVLLLLMMEVESGNLALWGGLILLGVMLFRRPELRCRSMILAGALICVWVLRSVIGLPWVDGLEGPWWCQVRSDAFLPQLTGNEQVVFPWNVTVTKLLPLAGAAVCFTLAAVCRKHRGRAVPAWLTWTLLLLAAAAAVIVIRKADIPESSTSLWQLHEILNGRGQDSFGSERWGVWRHTLHLAAQNLLFGIGPDTFKTVMAAHLTAEGASLTQTFDAPHNIYLSILVSNGLPALLLFLGSMGVILRKACKDRKLMPLGAAIACYLVQGFFSFSIVIVSPMFWAVAGMAAAGTGTREEMPEPVLTETGARPGK